MPLQVRSTQRVWHPGNCTLLLLSDYKSTWNADTYLWLRIDPSQGLLCAVRLIICTAPDKHLSQQAAPLQPEHSQPPASCQHACCHSLHYSSELCCNALTASTDTCHDPLLALQLRRCSLRCPRSLQDLNLQLHLPTLQRTPAQAASPSAAGQCQPRHHPQGRPSADAACAPCWTGWVRAALPP